VNVPRNVVEYGFKHVESDEAYPALYQSARQQASLTEPIHPITLANLFRLLREFESLTCLFRSHECVGLVERRIHERGIGARVFEVLNGLVDFLPPASPSIYPDR
jgi:hypothetical protein